METFEHLGYFKEFYIDKRFIGSINCEKDREEIGYDGRKNEIVTDTLTLTNGKKIKAGKEVTTIIYPLCGKRTS